MKVQINEVWNSEGRSEKLAVIETQNRHHMASAVYDWIAHNRPDLSLASSLDAHGFHAEVIHS